MTKHNEFHKFNPDELGKHELAGVWQQLIKLREEAFENQEHLDEDKMSDQQHHIINNLRALESEWIIDPIKRAQLSIIASSDDGKEDTEE